MYQKKSNIIAKIQSYHNRVAGLYHKMQEKTTDDQLLKMINKMEQREKERAEYLEHHRKVAEVMDSWLESPCNKISGQIEACFEDFRLCETVEIADVIKTELYFDNCLIKLYNILASKDALNETITNTFYYMLKKTKEEEHRMAASFCQAIS
ncbi:MAG: hypothetical protein R6T91_05555 [Bacteroidales bacterium]